MPSNKVKPELVIDGWTLREVGQIVSNRVGESRSDKDRITIEVIVVSSEHLTK